MVCPKCGQEIIDTKDFCVNCGQRLTKQRKVSRKSILIMLVIMILAGLLTCYIIINYNTEGELAPYINNK